MPRPRRKLAKVGDRIRYKAQASSMCDGTVKSIGSDYLQVELDSPRPPYYHEVMLGYKPEELMADSIRRHGEYEITAYVEDTR